MLVQEPRGGDCADAGDTRVAVRGVAHEGQVIRDQRGIHAELLPHARCVTDLVLPPIHLHHPVAPNTLREILVVGPDAHLLDPFVCRRQVRRGGEGVVGFQLDHGPDHDAHRGQRLFERLELRPEHPIDARAGLVVGPEFVPEGFDDVIGGDAEMGRVLLDHLENRVEHAHDRTVGLVLPLVEAALAVELAEEFVGAVDEVDDHVEEYSCRDGLPASWVMTTRPAAANWAKRLSLRRPELKHL